MALVEMFLMFCMRGYVVEIFLRTCAHIVSQSNQDILVASGSLTLAGGSAAGVAIFTFSNSTWAGLGNQADLPGPVTAVEVNNGNASSIFAAGRSSDGTTPFLSFWNGLSWTALRKFLQKSAKTENLNLL
jgi:hypothetical protein